MTPQAEISRLKPPAFGAKPAPKVRQTYIRQVFRIFLSFVGLKAAGFSADINFMYYFLFTTIVIIIIVISLLFLGQSMDPALGPMGPIGPICGPLGLHRVRVGPIWAPRGPHGPHGAHTVDGIN